MGAYIAQGITGALLAALALGGCAAGSPSGGGPSATPAPRPSPSASADPNTAEAKLVLFDETNRETVAAPGTPKGRDFVDALVAAGFDKRAMELTSDTTAIGLAADNIQFSVRIEDDCLVGQFGNVGYRSAILPALESSGCLVGSTRSINW